jgi:hypothetical protein
MGSELVKILTKLDCSGLQLRKPSFAVFVAGESGGVGGESVGSW